MLAILERVSKRAPVNLEDMTFLLPGCTWNQLFSAIDHLSREGKVALRRVGRCTYLLSLGPQFTGRHSLQRGLSRLFVSETN